MREGARLVASKVRVGCPTEATAAQISASLVLASPSLAGLRSATMAARPAICLSRQPAEPGKKNKRIVDKIGKK